MRNHTTRTSVPTGKGKAITTEESKIPPLAPGQTQLSRRSTLTKALPAVIAGGSLMQGIGLHANLRTQKLVGIPHFDLASVAGNLGMKAFWAEPGKSLLLRSKWTTIQFDVDARDFLLNKRKVYLGHPVRIHGERPFITEKDYELTIRPILAPQTLAPRPVVQTILLDPGHGGRDQGAQNPGLKLLEKDLTLDVSLRLQKLLAAEGIKVYLTRKDDTYIPLDKRGELASKVKADLFISVHFNSVGRPAVSGLETFVLPQPWTPSSTRSKLEAMDKQSYPGNKSDGWNSLAGFYIHRTLIEKLGVEDRGLKRSRFKVLKNLTCPGMLVELGFISHPATAQKLRTSAHRNVLAQSLLQGVQSYRKTQHRVLSRV